jgi:predicted esterase
MNPLVIKPSGAHKSTVILLHGLGDSGHGWYGAAEMLSSQLPNTKWILPNAPSIKISLNYGASMPGWYDILSLSPNAKEDETGLYKSIGTLSSLISDEIKVGIESNKIILAGFSQGAALSLLYGISTNVNLVTLYYKNRLD